MSESLGDEFLLDNFDFNDSLDLYAAMNRCQTLEFMKKNMSSDTDIWLKELFPVLDWWCEGVALLVICSLGIIGNLLSIMVLTSHDIDLKPSFATILICLALYDLVFSVCEILMYSVKHFSNGYKTEIWPYLVPYTLGIVHMAMTGSVYTTIAVAVERCVTVCAPFTNIKMYGGALYIVPIVAFSFLFNINKFYEVETYMETVDNVTIAKVRQLPEYTTTSYVASTRITNCIVMGLIPMVVLMFLNYLIYRAVSKAHAHHNSITQGNAHRRDSTMAALLLGIVIVFMMCHSIKISLNVYEAYQVMELWPCSHKLAWGPKQQFLSIVSSILIGLNSSINILIYVFKDFKFRQVLGNIICGRKNTAKVTVHQRRAAHNINLISTRVTQIEVTMHEGATTNGMKDTQL